MPETDVPVALEAIRKTQLRQGTVLRAIRAAQDAEAAELAEIDKDLYLIREELGIL